MGWLRGLELQYMLNTEFSPTYVPWHKRLLFLLCRASCRLLRPSPVTSPEKPATLHCGEGATSALCFPGTPPKQSTHHLCYVSTHLPSG